MVCHPSMVARLTGTLALAWAVWSSAAQSSLPPPGQSAFGSSSDDTSASALSRGAGHPLDINSQIQAPQNIFIPSVDDSMSQPMAPPVNTLEQMVKQKPNWTEMTPDEILGVQTSSPKEQQARELAARMIASGQPLPNQSALETFLMNRRLAETGSTNLNVPDEGGSFLDPATGRADPRRVAALQNGSAIHSQLFNRLLENAQDSFNHGGHANPDADWARVFTAPMTSAPSPAQQADMSAFLQLLQPTVSPESAADKSGFGFPKPVALPDSNLEPVPAGYNPAGGSYAPVQSGVSRPKGVAGLPTATTLPTVPSLTPTWGPQPPPWKRTGPQLFVEPVRQF